MSSSSTYVYTCVNRAAYATHVTTKQTNKQTNCGEEKPLQFCSGVSCLSVSVSLCACPALIPSTGQPTVQRGNRPAGRVCRGQTGPTELKAKSHSDQGGVRDSPCTPPRRQRPGPSGVWSIMGEKVALQSQGFPEGK